MGDNGNITKKRGFRYVFMAALMVFLAVVFSGRLFNMQLIEGEAYASGLVSTATRTVSLPAARGEIYDRYGRPLVSNRISYNVLLNRAGLPVSMQNDILLLLLKTLDEESLVYTDVLPISHYPYEYLVGETEAAQEKIASRIKRLLGTYGLSEDATAAELMDKIKQNYGLRGFNEGDARRLAGLRYDIDVRGFTAKTPYLIAEDVSGQVMTVLAENREGFPGVEVQPSAVREYTTTLAAHILGRVGSISGAELSSYLAKGYQMNDKVGTEGIEYTMEEWLRGISGVRTVEQTSAGQTKILSETPPTEGADVYLTLDLELQETAEKALAQTISDIAAAGLLRPDGKGADACAGAVVMLDAKTSSVLAMASNPTYNLSTFSEDFATLRDDPLKPFHNRAISGAYAPGSTFKMSTALAALKSGSIMADTIIRCTGIYERFLPYRYFCWIYTDYGVGHGNMTVREAIKHSCNSFFYEAGFLTGINIMNYWSSRLGFGQKTGIELTGENSGVVAGPDYAEMKGERWSDGQTITAAIGQSYNLVTPLQLANYVAAIVNGGYLNKAHIVGSVRRPSDNSILLKKDIEQLEDLELDKNTYDTIVGGMNDVTNDGGTAASVFRNYPITVGGKTGTASVGSGTATGVFVCFAPVEDPEVVIAVIIEHGGSGNAVAPVARALLDKYLEIRAREESATSLIP